MYTMQGVQVHLHLDVILGVADMITLLMRQELATREHVLDHGQFGPSILGLFLTPASFRRTSNANDHITHPGVLVLQTFHPRYFHVMSSVERKCAATLNAQELKPFVILLQEIVEPIDGPFHDMFV